MTNDGPQLTPPRPPAPPLSERPTKRIEEQDFGDLVKRTAKDAAHLIEQESLLLKREIELKVDHAQATVAIGTVGVVGVLVTLLTASATAILALSVVLPGWAAGLIVTAFWAVSSAMSLGWAKKRFEEQSPEPQITQQSVRRDVRVLAEATEGKP